MSADNGIKQRVSHWHPEKKDLAGENIKLRKEVTRLSKLCKTYFEVAAECFGESEVLRRVNARLGGK